LVLDNFKSLSQQRHAAGHQTRGANTAVFPVAPWPRGLVPLMAGVLGDCVAENAALTSSSALLRRLAPE